MYTKINKTQVITRLLEGKEVVLCPNNLRLNTPWHCESIINIYNIISKPIFTGDSRRKIRKAATENFNIFLNHYMYYNCSDETGNKVNYFIKW